MNTCLLFIALDLDLEIEFEKIVHNNKWGLGLPGSIEFYEDGFARRELAEVFGGEVNRRDGRSGARDEEDPACK